MLTVELPGSLASSYPVWIASKLLSSPALWLPASKSKIVIVTDGYVKKQYASLLAQLLRTEGYETLLLSFPAGEKSKNSRTKCQLDTQMLKQGCDKDTLILAVGGGVVGDLAGFVAATYMRGIAYMQLATTLLAMVDSSIGGKTGIDTPQGKNLIGAFWQPQAVVADVACLKTLPKRHIINGLIEALKMFLTSDASSLHALEKNLDVLLSYDEQKLITVIHQAVKIKAGIVKNDEKESNQRMVLNLGHTIGHALEQLTHYQLLHGYAVALGLLVEAKIAQLMGLLDAQHYQFIKALLMRLGIAVDDLRKFAIQEIIKATQLDKKRRAGSANYVLLNGLGKVYTMENQFAHPIADEVVKRAFFAVIEN